MLLSEFDLAVISWAVERGVSSAVVYREVDTLTQGYAKSVEDLMETLEYLQSKTREVANA